MTEKSDTAPPPMPPSIATPVAIVDLATGAILRLTQREVDGLDPDSYRRATARDLAIGE